MSEQVSVFQWYELATDSVCRLLITQAGAPNAPLEQIRSLVGHILAHTGGLPAVRGVPGPDELHVVATGLLYEAFRHTLAELGFTVGRRGYALLEDRIVTISRVDVNTAGESQLEPLPIIGPKTAAAIVDERLTGGSFRSVDDFEKRIAGIGSGDMQALSGVLAFIPPTHHWRTLPYDRLSLSDCLVTLLSLGRRADPVERLIHALETVATISADSPHPSSLEKRIREAVAFATEQHATDEVHVLSGSSYYGMAQEAIAAAMKSISVAMFHIALPKENHPTLAILDALAAAKQRGTIVRVLVDRDQESDPYKSEIINRPALEYLRERGVECRSDETQRLLHSKFLVLDGKQVIIGSHNWSAGSYFQFDDTSVLIASQDFAATMTQRFDAMWNKGTA